MDGTPFFFMPSSYGAKRSKLWLHALPLPAPGLHNDRIKHAGCSQRFKRAMQWGQHLRLAYGGLGIEWCSC